MAIVGTAFVRLRVIGDKLAGDIGNQVKKSVEQSAPDLAKAGENVGEKVGDSAGKQLETTAKQQMGRVADQIGDAIGTRMAENLGKSLRRRAGDKIREGIAGTRGQITRIGNSFKGHFDGIGKQWGEAIGKGFKGIMGKLMVSAISLLVVALPSMLAWTGAVAGALGASLVPAIGAIGPAAAGAGLAYIAAMSSMKISTGLLKLALDTATDAQEDFKKRADDFKKSVASPIQAGFLSGLNAAMRIAGPLVDRLSPALTRFGTQAGDVAINLADVFTRTENADRMTRILNTQTAVVRSAGAGVTSFAQVALILLDNLRPVTEMLARGVHSLGGWALGSIRAAEESGRLQGFIERMMTALQQGWRIARDFGIGLFNVFRTAMPVSNQMAGGLERIAARFREWTSDTDNQERMRTFFQRMWVIARAVLAVFGQLGRAAGTALEGTDVNSVLQGLTSLVSLGASIGRMFEDIRAAAGPALGEAFANFVTMIQDLANSGVLGVLATAFSNLFQAISFLLQIPGVAAILSLVAGLAAMFKTVQLLMVVLRPLGIVFNVLRIILVAVAGVIGWLPVVIGLLVAALIWFFTQTETGRAIIAAVWEGIKAGISAAVDGIVAAWNWMVDMFQSVWAVIQTVATAIWEVIKTVFTTIFNFYVTIWTAIFNVVRTVFTAIWGFIQTVLGVILAIWSRIWPLLMLPVRIFYGVVILIWQTLLAGIRIVLTAIWGVITTVWNAVYGFISGIVQTIWGVIKGAWDAIYNAIYGALFRAYVFIMARFIVIRAFIQGVMQAIWQRIQNAWNNVVGVVSGALSRVWGVIKGVWDRIVGFIRGAMDRIGDIAAGAWEMLGNVGSGVMDGLKAAVNVVIDAINTVIEGINWAIDLANKLPGADIPRIPAIPHLAQGGVISPTAGGTLALVAEAGRSERVEPLDRSGLSNRDHAMIEALAGRGGSGDTHVYIGQRELVEIVDVVVEERETDLGRRVLTGRKAG